MKLPDLKSARINPKSQTIASAYLLLLKDRTRRCQRTALLRVEENRKTYTHDNLTKAWIFTIMRAIFLPDFYYGQHIDTRHLKKITDRESGRNTLYNIESLSVKNHIPCTGTTQQTNDHAVLPVQGKNEPEAVRKSFRRLISLIRNSF